MKSLFCLNESASLKHLELLQTEIAKGFSTITVNLGRKHLLQIQRLKISRGLMPQHFITTGLEKGNKQFEGNILVTSRKMSIWERERERSGEKTWKAKSQQHLVFPGGHLRLFSVSYPFFIVQRDWGKDELVGVGLKHFYFNSLAANYRV